jgi:hypothetical protein
MARRGRGVDGAKRKHWQGLIRQWRQSGQSVREFCRDAEIKEWTFYWWRQKLAQSCHGATGGRAPSDARGAKPATGTVGRKAPDQAPVSFLPVQVVPGQAGEVGSGVEIHWSNGRSVRLRRGFDRQTLAEVLAVLETRPC